MHKKSVEDYLKEGIHGPRRPLEGERRKFLGTLRERIVLALTIEQVMSDSGLRKLEETMRKHPDTKLLINGHVSFRFTNEEKALARKYNIPYTVITNEEHDTNIGAVLTYDYAINKENIFIEDLNEQKEREANQDNLSFLQRIKNYFSF